MHPWTTDLTNTNNGFMEIISLWVIRRNIFYLVLKLVYSVSYIYWLRLPPKEDVINIGAYEPTLLELGNVFSKWPKYDSILDVIIEAARSAVWGSRDNTHHSNDTNTRTCYRILQIKINMHLVINTACKNLYHIKSREYLSVYCVFNYIVNLQLRLSCSQHSTYTLRTKGYSWTSKRGFSLSHIENPFWISEKSYK